AAIRDFGEQLGEEIAVGAGMDEKGEPVQPLILAELKNPGAFRGFVDEQMQKLPGKKEADIQWIDDPQTAQPITTDAGVKDLKHIYVWINGDVLVGSPKLDQLQRVAANPQTSFTSSAFRNRIAEVYREGAGIVVAADLEKIVPRVGS